MGAYLGDARSSAGRSAAPSGLSLASESQAKPAATIADDLLKLGAELLEPKTGIMRGIFGPDTDRDDKLLRIRVGELRKINRFIAGACRILSPEE